MKIEKSEKEHNNNINITSNLCVRVCVDDKILIQFNFKKVTCKEWRVH